MPLPVSPNKCMLWKFFYLKIFVLFMKLFQPFFCLFLEKSLWKQQENGGPTETDLAKEFIDVCD